MTKIMKILMVSYSHTGNNRLLADHLGRKLNADRETITASGRLTGLTIALDMLFNRKPGIAPAQHDPADYDTVVLAAPIWMGKIASPLRSYLQQHRSQIKRFAFITISGGALGPNNKVPDELHELAGTAPVEARQLYINDLLAESEKGERGKTSSYRLNQEDLDTPFAEQIDDFIGALTRASQTTM